MENDVTVSVEETEKPINLDWEKEKRKRTGASLKALLQSFSSVVRRNGGDLRIQKKKSTSGKDKDSVRGSIGD